MEPLAETLRFYQEFLPLCGYLVHGHGKITTSRNFFKLKRSTAAELLLLRLPPFAGTVLLRPVEETAGTMVEAEMADLIHPDPNREFDITNPRSHPNIRWVELDEI